MQAINFMHKSFDSDTDEAPNSCPETSKMDKSPAATVVELGINLAHAELSGSIPGSCCRCRSNRDLRRSTSHYPKVFCSERCEQDFIRIALASLTLEDCIRMQKRLESLFVNTAEPCRMTSIKQWRATQAVYPGETVVLSDIGLSQSRRVVSKEGLEKTVTRYKGTRCMSLQR